MKEDLKFTARIVLIGFLALGLAMLVS